MAFRIPRFDRSIPLVNKDLTPNTTFHQWWDRVARGIESSINGIQDALNAAGIALSAAGAAQAAADDAQAAANAAQGAADSVGVVSKLTNSGCTGLTITATDAGTNATVTISAHTRVYGNGSTVAVGGGSVTGLAYGTGYYIYYDDPEFDGLSITYLATTSEATAAQINNRHLVGAVTTPLTGQPDAHGDKVRPPGLDNLPAY